jgi:flagellar hook-associated protein FlgK
MSLFSAISTLNSALTSFTYAQDVISENIANVDTTGYTDEVTNLAALPNLSGVSVLGVGSTRDIFLYNQLYSQLADQNFDTTRLASLNQIASILPEVADSSATDGLSGAISTLSTAWSNLATVAASATSTTAQVAAAKGTVLDDLQALAKMFNTDSNQLYELQENVNTQVASTVTQINSLEDSILSLNKQIVSLGGQQSAQTSTLIDQRESDIETLCGLTGASVAPQTNGAMTVTFNGGPLVDGTSAYHLGVIPSTTIPGMSDIGYVSTTGTNQMADVTADFTNGTLGALLYEGNTDIQTARLTLDQMASGIITTSNEINEAYTAPGQVAVPVFIGSKASDMALNPALLNDPDALAATNDTANKGDLATVQSAMLSGLNMYDELETVNITPGEGGIQLTSGTAIDPTKSLASQAALGVFATNPTASGTLVLSAGGNAVDVTWNNSMTLNQIVQQINTDGGGAIYAVLSQDANGQYVHIYSDAPLTAYDASGNLSQVLYLDGYMQSSSPINNSPVTGLNKVTSATTLASLNMFTQPSTSGVIELDNDPAATVAWTSTMTISQLIRAINNASAANGLSLQAYYSTATQEVEFTNVNNGATATAPVTTPYIQDVSGNLTSVLNLEPDSNATKLYSQLTSFLSASVTSMTEAKTQATNLVTATQKQQAAESAVNLDTEEALAETYANAYDAAVRMQYVLEDMLNYMITQTGSSNSNQSPLG